MQIKSFLSLVPVILTSFLAACAQLGGSRPQSQVAPAPLSQQELDLREYQMLQSSVLNQWFATQRAHDIAWFAVHEDGGIRNHAGCYRVPAALMSSQLYDQFSQLMVMVYRGRCVTEVTTFLVKKSQPKAGKK